MIRFIQRYALSIVFSLNIICGYSQNSSEVIKTVTINNVSTTSLQAKRYKIAEIGYNSSHWQEGGIIQVELFHKYFGVGYEKYFVEVGYSQGTDSSTPSLRHMESSGTWHTAKVTLGNITDMGTSYAGHPNKVLPIYVDVRFYSNYVVKVTFMRNRVTELNAMNQIIINEAPSVLDISDFEVPEGAKSLYIAESGNIGVGTQSPWTKLDIVGKIGIRAADGGYRSEILNENSNSPTAQAFSFLNAGGQNLLSLNYNGNIGIGTIAPTSLLELGTNVPIAATRLKIIGYSDTFPLTEWGDGGVVSTKIIRTTSNIMKMVTSNYAGSFSFVGNYDFAGNLGIGTTNIPTDYKLAVAGNIIAEKVKVKKSNTWPDFVFSPTYKLPNLSEIENFVKQNSHLPEIPSAAEIEKDGQDLGEMNRLLLKKVEELTLYLIELKKENEMQNIEIEKLKAVKK